MEKSRRIAKPFVLSLLSVALLVGCGGKTLSNWEVLKNEADASGEEIPVGTYDEEQLVVAYTDDYSDEERLYIAMSYANQQAQVFKRSIYRELVFFLEEDAGTAQFGSMSFDFMATLDLESGTASALSNVSNTTGSPDQTVYGYVEGFLDAAAGSLKTFLTAYRFAENRGEDWVISKLEGLGYVLNTYDEDSHNYLEGQIQQQHGLDVEVKKLYQGYINQVDRWVQVIVFADEWQATQYFYKRWNAERGQAYNYHYRTRNVFLFTSSYDTWLEVSSSATD